MMIETMSAPDREIEQEDLVREAQSGDRGAFGALYGRYVRMVHGVLLSRVPADDVEDLVQDVFVTALRQIASLHAPEAFGGWLAAIARNRATDFYRSPLRRWDELDNALPGRANEEARREAQAVLKAIRELPEAYRETLMLRLVEGMTGPEIAEQTNLTPDSVRVNLFRGMKLLRERLGGAKK